MAKANRQLKKFKRKLQLKRGLRVSVSQGKYKFEIWECEAGVWAYYLDEPGKRSEKYFGSFSKCVEALSESATELGCSLASFQKAMNREINNAIDQNILPATVLNQVCEEPSDEQFERSIKIHKLAIVGKPTGLDKYDGSSCDTKCCCC